MVNPRFGYDDIPGLGVPGTDEAKSVRWGLMMQYERNPVTGYRLDEELGTIVANRLAAHFGVSVDATSWLTARIVVPANANWGSQFPQLEASGAGLGDIYAGLSVTMPIRTPYFGLGLRGDLQVPTGRSQAYMGERSVRGIGGLDLRGTIPVRFKGGDELLIDLVADATVVGRRVLITNQDFDHGSELWISQGARLKLPRIPLRFTQSLLVRGGFTNFFQGGAENGVEIMGGVQVPIEKIAFNTKMTVDVMAGRGVNQGYGTTDFRLLAGITFTRNPGKKPQPIPEVVVERPPPVVPVEVEPEPEPEWTSTEVARVVEDQIVIDDPIEFLVDTPIILEHSLPVLSSVATIMNGEARIRHLVIEGHASEEGDFEYNYELSTRRAEAVFKQLILYGVAPDRLSYKGYGEVRPKVEGSTEEAWAVNRRVEFHIVGLYDMYDAEAPTYGGTQALPWSGELAEMTKLVIPEKAVEIDEFEAARQAEEAERKAFTEPDEAEGFQFEDEQREPRRRRTTDELEGESFEDPEEEKGDDFEFEGSTSGGGKPPAEAPPAEEPPAEEPPAEEPPAEAPPAEEPSDDEAGTETPAGGEE
jgi:peptidoglycan-associated lipoprotein